MNTPGHASIAALLYPQGGDVRPTEDSDGHELMDYFKHDYPYADNISARTDPAANLVPLPSNAISTHERPQSDPKRSTRGGQQQQNVELSRYLEATSTSAPPGRSATPPNPSIPIPATLARIASKTTASLEIPSGALTSEDALEEPNPYPDYGDKGEMGGKRRKQPHERAGWKEMDEKPPGKKRRAKKGDIASASADAVIGAAAELASYAGQGASPAPLEGHGDQPAHQDMRSLSELSRMALQGPHGDDNTQVDPALQATDENNDAPVTADSPGSKLSRAEQNKRAQQAYRRRREEHMKKLEMDSARLEGVKRQLADKEAALREVVLSLSASKIEVAALQSALRSVIPHIPSSILTKEGHLVVDEGVQARDPRKPNEEAVDGAFELLSAQSRELAKHNLRR
ncbi:hypothetical protein IAR55_001463 [Kwoniella newhampshirensis]|uniref:BZIP domain-containing protein n=1 Tax=Kwoniella newhampshirensis TaxID=1651941 RepID=A0AAW0Z2B5_9TREE